MLGFGKLMGIKIGSDIMKFFLDFLGFFLLASASSKNASTTTETANYSGYPITQATYYTCVRGTFCRNYV